MTVKNSALEYLARALLNFFLSLSLAFRAATQNQGHGNREKFQASGNRNCAQRIGQIQNRDGKLRERKSEVGEQDSETTFAGVAQARR